MFSDDYYRQKVFEARKKLDDANEDLLSAKRALLDVDDSEREKHVQLVEFCQTRVDTYKENLREYKEGLQECKEILEVWVKERDRLSANSEQLNELNLFTKLEEPRRQALTPAQLATLDLIHDAVGAPPALPSIYVKFNFNQRGGRMQMNQFAVDYSFHGRIRRIHKEVLHCLIVFPSQDEDPQSIARLSAFMAVARSLPDFAHIEHGLSTRYSEFLARPFEVMKTTPHFVDENLNSDEPEDAISELESVSGASSYNY